jgi:CRISPR-associated protein Csx10
MGSVFLFSTEQPLDADAYALLAMLQQDGIGERRAEGYGQLRVCDEFHMEYAWGGTNA